MAHQQTLIKPPYENIKFLDLDGEFLFFGNSNKVKFYVSRNLAKQVSEGVYQLLFKAKARGVRGDAFYEQVMQNKCVVCGKEDELTKHHIVPYCYRQFLPAERKDSSCHDIMPICASCHNEYEEAAFILKKNLAKQYDVPVDGYFESPIGNVALVDFKHLGALCRTLLSKHLSKIPKDRQDIIKDRVKTMLNESEELTTEKLKSIVSLKKVCQKSGGQLVLEKVPSIQDFIMLWRQHFLDTMKPKFMPEHWSVERIEK